MSSIITKVAIVGVTGRVGGYMARALVATGKHTVTGLTRKGNTKALPSGVTAVEVDYSSQESLESALRGQEFLFITLSARAPDDLHSRITAAAGAAGVKYIMPNLYTSYDPATPELAKLRIGKGGARRIQDVKDAGCKAIAMVCGFWYEWSLAMGTQWYGFDIAKRTVTFFDDGKQKISTSTWEQCGRAVAALLSLAESGASPAVADWSDKEFYLYSFRVSQRDMLDSLNRVLGTTDADWTITYVDVKQWVEEGEAGMAKGDFLGFAKLMYGPIFDKAGHGDFAAFRKTANKTLDLPEENLDEVTKRVVEMVENGWDNSIEG